MKLTSSSEIARIIVALDCPPEFPPVPISIGINAVNTEACSSLSKYDFLALPVVDMENRLVGIITVDDAIDVIQEENTEDIQKMAAITPTSNSISFTKHTAARDNPLIAPMRNSFHITLKISLKLTSYKETIYTCYVTDASRHLIGVTTVKELLLSDSDDVIEDFMETKVISINTLDDQETATRTLSKICRIININFIKHFPKL